MRIYLLILVLAGLLVACSKKLVQEANTPEKSGLKIAYNVFMPNTKSDYNVFAMNLDGSGQKDITNHPDVAWTYYAYDNRLFFISDRDTCYRCYFLYETDAEGQNVRKVSNLQLEDSWMSARNRGGEMVVAGRIGREVRYQLFVVNTSDGSYRQITNDTAALHRDPLFSPDGKQIVFAYQANKRDQSQHEELFIMDANGAGKRQLTHFPANDPAINEHHYKAGPPKWNAREGFISYQSHQNGKYSLYAVTPDGKKQWKLTDRPEEEGWHDWSPDGRYLAVEIYLAERKEYHIALMDWKTKAWRVLTDSTYKYHQAPVFVRK